MDYLNQTTNDIELTELRFKEEKKNGFPIWLLTIKSIDAKEKHEVFFSKSALDKKVKVCCQVWGIGLECLKVELLFANDVKHVSYELRDVF